MKRKQSSKKKSVSIILVLFFASLFFYFYTLYFVPRSDVYLLKLHLKSPMFYGGLELIGSLVGYKIETVNHTPVGIDNFKLFYNTTLYDLDNENLKYVEFYLIPQNNIYPKYSRNKTNNVAIEVIPADSKIKPYLLDSKYCVADQDCVVRQDWSNYGSCPYGVFGKYETYVGGGECYRPQGEYDEKDDCYRKEIYTNPRCENNECMGTRTLDNNCTYYKID